MSLFRLTIAKTCSSLSKILIAPKVNSVRSSAVLFSTSPHRFCQANDEDTPEENDKKKKNFKPDRDRSTVIPVETSIQYLTSDAYKETYGTRFVWERYRRNHKGQLPPRKTRESCIIQDYVSTGNPCPICRDEYLIFHYTNLQLLKQFISPFTGEVRDPDSIFEIRDGHFI